MAALHVAKRGPWNISEFKVRSGALLDTDVRGKAVPII